MVLLRLSVMAGKLNFLICKLEVIVGFSGYTSVLYNFMKAAVPWGPSESDLGLQHPSCWTPMWSDCHSMPTLCRMQLVPSFPRGFCFIEGPFNQVTDGGSGLRVKKTEEGKAELPYNEGITVRWGAQMVSLSQAPKIYSGKETETAFC